MLGGVGAGSGRGGSVREKNITRFASDLKGLRCAMPTIHLTEPQTSLSHPRNPCGYNHHVPASANHITMSLFFELKSLGACEMTTNFLIMTDHISKL